MKVKDTEKLLCSGLKLALASCDHFSNTLIVASSLKMYIWSMMLAKLKIGNKIWQDTSSLQQKLDELGKKNPSNFYHTYFHHKDTIL